MAEPMPKLTLLRIAWGAMLLGQLTFAAVVGALLFLSGDAEGSMVDAGFAHTLFLIAVGLIIVAVPVALFVRNQVYKANWVGNAITPDGYFNGNIVLFAVMDGVASLALVGLFVTAGHWGFAAVAAAAILAHGANFPTGRPLQPTPPEIGEDPAP